MDDISVTLAMLPDKGEQINMNHVDCPAGEDTRKRLYIKRADGMVLAYCHNCGGSAAFREQSALDYRTFERSDYDKLVEDAPKIVDDDIQLPESGSSHDGGHEIQKYLQDECGLSTDTLLESGIYYSPSLNRMVIPIHDTEGKLIYWQARSFKEGVPKYINVKGVSKPLLVLKNKHNLDRPYRTIIVEDAISAWRVWQDFNSPNTQIIALLGTKVGMESLLPFIPDGSHYIYVWLDEDVAGRQGSLALVSSLSTLCNVKRVDTTKYKQPKRCTSLEINTATMNAHTT